MHRELKVVRPGGAAGEPAEGWFEREVLGLVAPGPAAVLAKLDPRLLARATEIRLRRGRPLVVGRPDGDRMVRPDGRAADEPASAYIVTGEDVAATVELISGYSLYAWEEELRNGFITVPGGHRVGICGRAVLQDGRVRTLRSISALNFRLSREIAGSADPVMPYLVSNGRVRSALIVSPPGAGKTTILRDAVRQLSDGIPRLGFQGVTVGVVDERSELAGSYEGVPQRCVGVRTDVLDACPKAEGMMMLIRSMSPRVLATDELGRPADLEAVREAASAGVAVLASAHGRDLGDVAARPLLGALLRERLFERLVVLGVSLGPGTVELVHDAVGDVPLRKGPIPPSGGPPDGATPNRPGGGGSS